MPRVLTASLRPGWYLASHVHNHLGLLLLAPGTRLRPSHIHRLAELGVWAVEVDVASPIERGGGDLVSPETRAKAVAEVYRAIDLCRKGELPDATRLRAHARALIREIVRNWGAPAAALDVRARATQVAAHSVNVCALSLVIGRSLGLSGAALEEMSLGTLLHDIGRARSGAPQAAAPDDRRSRPEEDQSRPEEDRRLRPEHADSEHTWDGFEILRLCPGVTTAAAFVALHHHERLDGSGYPTGVGGRRIGTYARISAVADLFDALTADWPHESAMNSVAALDAIRALAPEKLWSEAVQAFSEYSAAAPAQVLTAGD